METGTEKRIQIKTEQKFMKKKKVKETMQKSKTVLNE